MCEHSKADQNLDFTSVLFSEILKTEIRVDTLKAEASVFTAMIAELLRSNQQDQPVTLRYHRKKRKVSIGLTEDVITKLEQAAKDLGTGVFEPLAAKGTLADRPGPSGKQEGGRGTRWP